MRILKLTLTILLFLFIFSCSNNSEDENIADKLVGNWRAYNGTVTECDDFNDNRPAINYGECPNPPSGQCLEYFFKSDGTVTTGYQTTLSSYVEYDGTYTTSGSTLNMCFPHFTDCFIRQVSFTDSTMTTVSTPASNGCVSTSFFTRF